MDPIISPMSVFHRKDDPMRLLKNIPVLNKKPMRDIIYDHLRKAIVRGELKADSAFTDSEIAKEFGVSRTPVREAVQRLEAEGYIERVPMKGNRVCSVSPFELANSLATRKALETLALRYAALRITAEELASLEKLLAEADKVFAEFSGEELLDRFFPIVKKFNKIVFEACRSERLTEFIWILRELFDRFTVMRIVLPERTHKSLLRRKKLYAALAARSPDEAAAVWAEHLEESFVIWREKSGYSEELADFKFL